MFCVKPSWKSATRRTSKVMVNRGILWRGGGRISKEVQNVRENTRCSEPERRTRKVNASVNSIKQSGLINHIAIPLFAIVLLNVLILDIHCVLKKL